MPDNKPNETSLALLNERMDQLTRKIGILDSEDPRRTKIFKEMLRLNDLARKMKKESPFVKRIEHATDRSERTAPEVARN
jgi:hypothetical protein